MKYDAPGDGSGCIGLYTLAAFGLVFIRWMGIIRWSWWIVMAPLYVPATIILALGLIEIIRGAGK